MFFKDLFEFQFLQFAVIAAILCSIAGGSIGSFVVVRRSTYVAGAIAHSALGGIGFARYAEIVLGWYWMTPMWGAMLAALASAGIISATRIWRSERQDTIMSAIWALGMALGITFITATPGYTQDLGSHLFGDILLVSTSDIWVMLGVVITIGLFFWFTFDRLVAASFNAQLAELRGINPQRYETILNILFAVTIVALVRIAGVVLVIALLTLPAATAARLTISILRMILLAILFGLVSTLGGLWISYELNLATGATMIELSVLIYAIVFLATRKK